MPIKLKYDENLKILVILVKGIIVLRDVEDAMKELFSSKEYPSNINTLWDVRELEYSEVDLKLIKSVVTLHEKYNNERENAKIAILSNYALAAPLIKLYIILTRGLKQTNRAFTNIDEAILWLHS